MSEEPDPWSMDVAAPPAPIEFVFNEPDQDAAASATVADPGRVDALAGAESYRAARHRIVGGIALGVLIVGIVIAALVRSDDNLEASTNLPAAPNSTTVDELPDASPPLSSPYPTTPTLGSGSTVQQELIPPGTWVDGSLIVPDRLTAIEMPTQLVAITDRGLVIEIDLAGGATSTLDLDERQSGARLQLRDRVGLITNNTASSGANPVLVERGQAAIEVEIPGRSDSLFVVDNGSNIDQFVIESYNNGSGGSATLAIETDGTVSEITTTWENAYFGQYEVITGEWLVFEAGDLFLKSPPGQEPSTARRISTGQLIGRSEQTLFVNECDDAGACGQFLIDIESEERIPVPEVDGVQFDRNRALASMSPDGTAMLIVYGQTGEAIFFDLASGNTAQLPFRIGNDFSSPEFSWAPDSSGIFALHSDEIVFVDRSTGDTTALPIHFANTDRIVDVRARPTPNA